MHESSLARQILAAVLKAAAEAGGGRVQTVRGWVAETESLSPESLRFHFDALSRGTPAEGAALELALTHVSAHCRGCGSEYLPEHHLLLCPDCGSTEAEALGQTGMGIDTIEVV